MTRRGSLLFAAMCVIWGVPYLMIRVAVRELTPVDARLRAHGARRAAPRARRGVARTSCGRSLARWWPLLVYTVIEIGVPWLLLARAETKLTSSLTGLLIAGVPLVGAVLVALTGERERLGSRRWLGLLVGLVGVAALVGLDLGSVAALPVAEMGTVAVCYAIGPIILARSLADVPALGVVAASLGLAALVYAPIAASSAADRDAAAQRAAVGRRPRRRLHRARVPRLPRADRRGRPGAGDGDHLRQPGGRAVLGVSVLGEKITAGMGVGFVLVLIGCVLATGGGPDTVAES